MCTTSFSLVESASLKYVQEEAVVWLKGLIEICTTKTTSDFWYKNKLQHRGTLPFSKAKGVRGRLVDRGACAAILSRRASRNNMTSQKRLLKTAVVIGGCDCQPLH